MRARIFPLLCAVAISAACHDHDVATVDDCRAIVERLTQLELEARGFRDPALARHRAGEFMSAYATLLDECPGKALPRGSRECMARARSSAELVRDCLGLPGHL